MARELGCFAEDILDHMSTLEFVEWMAFLKIQPSDLQTPEEAERKYMDLIGVAE